MHIDEGARMTFIGSSNKALERVALMYKQQLHSNPKEWKDEQLHQEMQSWCRVILQLDTSPGDFSASICSQHRINMRETEQKIMTVKDRIGSADCDNLLVLQIASLSNWYSIQHRYQEVQLDGAF
jgi:hypothetical protein